MTAGFPFIATHYRIDLSDETLKDCAAIQKKSSRAESRVFSNLMDSDNDFPSNCHPLAYFYGLAEFVIITPAGNETLDTENRINLVLSSITIAVNNTQW